MLITESKTLHDAIKPLVNLNYLVGLCAFQLPNQSNFTYIFRRLYAVVITIISWMTIYLQLTVLEEINESENMTPMTLTTQKALLFAGSGFTVMAPVLVWLRSEGLRNCLREMSILDNAFEVVRGFPNEYRRQYILMTCRVIAILLFTIFVCMYNIIASIEVAIQMEIQSLLLFCVSAYATHYQLLIALVLDLNFCTFVGKAHLELCKLARKSNRAFGLQNLLSMGISFAMTTGTLYTIYGVLSRKELTSVRLAGLFGNGIWTATQIFKIWMVNHSCWNASSEAKRTGEIIYELLNSKIDRKLQKEIQGFGVQMLQNPVRFNACGFFTLDFTFVQGVIGSVTTYLVILIQMSPKPQSSIFDAAFAGNKTGVSAN